MVPKDTLYQLYIEEIEHPLKQLESNKVNIQNYLSNMRVWFTRYVQKDIDKPGFKNFLKHLEEKTQSILSDVKSETKLKIVQTIENFLKEIESHSSDELTKEIETTLQKIKSSVDSLNPQKSLSSKLKIPIAVLAIIIFMVFGYIYYSSPLGNSLQTSFDNLSNINNNNNNNTVENISDTTNSSNKNLTDDTLDNYDSSPKQPPEPISIELTSLEKEIINSINSQRKEYYLEELQINHNYTAMLKQNKNNIAPQLGIETFVFETDEKITIKGEDVSSSLYSQMNKKNLFQEDLTHIAINIKELKYKLYQVQLAFYKQPEK